VIHAGVRDVADLTTMQFPVFSRAISAMGTVKETPGYVNIDIVCAGAVVHPGDIIVGDVDGIVVVPRQTAEHVVRACEARLAKEVKSRERLRAGELGLDMYGLREKLKNLGVEWVE
jgi:4-hydroxy-4-methyl-2-oxoglutarate aldolase